MTWWFSGSDMQWHPSAEFPSHPEYRRTVLAWDIAHVPPETSLSTIFKQIRPSLIPFLSSFSNSSMLPSSSYLPVLSTSSHFTTSIRSQKHSIWICFPEVKLEKNQIVHVPVAYWRDDEKCPPGVLGSLPTLKAVSHVPFYLLNPPKNVPVQEPPEPKQISIMDEICNQFSNQTIHDSSSEQSSQSSQCSDTISSPPSSSPPLQLPLPISPDLPVQGDELPLLDSSYLPPDHPVGQSLIPLLLTNPPECHLLFSHQLISILQRVWDTINDSVEIVPERYGGILLLHKTLAYRRAFLLLLPPLHMHGECQCLLFPAVKRSEFDKSIPAKDYTCYTVPCSIELLSSFIAYQHQQSQCLAWLPDGWRSDTYYRQRVLLGSSWRDGQPPFLLEKWAKRGGVAVLTAPCAAGKTFAVEQFFLPHLQHCYQTQPPLLLDMACGTTHVADKMKRWRRIMKAFPPTAVVDCYQLKKDPSLIENAMVVVSTRDSLLCIKRNPDFIFVDEMHTVWYEYVSNIMVTRADAIYNQMCKFWMTAKHVLFGEAFVNESDIRLVHHVFEMRKHYRRQISPIQKEPDVVLVRICKYQPTRRFILTQHPCRKLMAHEIKASSFHPIHHKRPLLIVSQTVKAADDVCQALVQKKCLSAAKTDWECYTRQTADEVRIRWKLDPGDPLENKEAENINQVIPQVDLFAFSPVLRAGFDMTAHCRSSIALLSTTGCGGSVGFLQQLYRSRHLSNPNIIVCCYNGSQSLMDSFSMSLEAARGSGKVRSYTQHQRDFWTRHLELQSYWVDIVSASKNILPINLPPESITIQDLPMTQRLRYDLIIQKDLQEENDNKTFGYSFVDYLIQNGDLYTIDWILPSYLSYFLITPSKFYQFAKQEKEKEKEKEKDEKVEEKEEKEEEEEEEEDEKRATILIDDLLNSSPSFKEEFEKIADGKQSQWVESAMALRKIVVDDHCATGEQHHIQQILRSMVTFGVPSARDVAFVEKQYPIQSDQFALLRNTFFGIQSADCEDEAHLRLYQKMTLGYPITEDERIQVFCSLDDCLHSEFVQVPGVIGLPGGIIEDSWARAMLTREYLYAWMWIMGLSETKTPGTGISSACSGSANRGDGISSACSGSANRGDGISSACSGSANRGDGISSACSGSANRGDGISSACSGSANRGDGISSACSGSANRGDGIPIIRWPRMVQETYRVKRSHVHLRIQEHPWFQEHGLAMLQSTPQLSCPRFGAVYGKTEDGEWTDATVQAWVRDGVRSMGIRVKLDRIEKQKWYSISMLPFYLLHHLSEQYKFI